MTIKISNSQFIIDKLVPINDDEKKIINKNYDLFPFNNGGFR